jgi:glycine/D-amino acid oxidase-like deaminating enzyme
MTEYRRVSLWFDQLAQSDPLEPRAGLDGDTDADVCIVGAGFTGLWTAYYLLKEQPQLRIVLLEQEIAGFGASGRNGGWCSALFPVGTGALVRRYGRDQAFAMRRAMNESVAEVGSIAAAEGIACDYAPGGSLYLARTAVQVRRAQAEVAADQALGGVDGLRWLTGAQASAEVGAAGVLGAVQTPHCARIQPARLVRGLATVVESLGGVIAEHTPALHLVPGSPGSPGPSVVTARGRVRARVVIRATEAWTATLPGSRRDVVPVYSLMVATQPLPGSFWAQAGLARGQTFNDERHLIVYGQRTADDRLAFGGRGAPYFFGSAIAPAQDRSPRVFSALRDTLRDLFPAMGDAEFTHAWGGPLAIPRDWHAAAGLDAETGIGWAGGYVGDGVGTANLAGRTLRDLVLKHLTLGGDTNLTTLPWVGHRSRRWEPEPLRWLGVNAGLLTMSAADAEERLTGRPSQLARMMAPFLGH